MVIHIHVTPRERERLIREERQRRRVARILQVRQQASEQAHLLLQSVRSEKKAREQELRRELRRSVSEKMSEVTSEEGDSGRGSLPSDSTTGMPSSSRKPQRLCSRTPRRHRHTFTKEDAIRALERGRQAQQRLLSQRRAQRKKALEAIKLRRQAVEEANRFNRATES